jgi:hypothetical protein
MISVFEGFVATAPESFVPDHADLASPSEWVDVH